MYNKVRIEALEKERDSINFMLAGLRKQLSELDISANINSASRVYYAAREETESNMASAMVGNFRQMSDGVVDKRATYNNEALSRSVGLAQDVDVDGGELRAGLIQLLNRYNSLRSTGEVTAPRRLNKKHTNNHIRKHIRKHIKNQFSYI